MANTAQAKKRARQAVQRRVRNVAFGSMVRTMIKKAVKAIKAGDPAAAKQAYLGAVPFIDRGARKGIIHKRKAARHKQRLNAALKKLMPVQAEV